MAKRVNLEPGDPFSTLPPRSRQLLFDSFLRDLQEGSPDFRRAAARALRGFGAEAVAPLCEALKDQDLGVRADAARSLGLLGNTRAVEPLAAALEGCFLARSPRRQITLGSMLGLALVFTLFCGWGRIVLPNSWYGVVAQSAVLVALISATGVLKARAKRQRQVVSAVIDALGRLADAGAKVELVSALPLVKAVAEDGYHQEPEVMKKAKEVAARIESLTADVSRMPLPAAPPAATADQLPRPAEFPGHLPEQLPRSCCQETGG